MDDGRILNTVVERRQGRGAIYMFYTYRKVYAMGVRLALMVCVGSLALWSLEPVLAQQKPEFTPPLTFDCQKIQGPLSTQFYERSRQPYKDLFDDTWKPSSPAAQNIDAELLEKAARRLNARLYVRSFLVVRNNQLVFERYYWGADKNDSYNVHSASKSIWGAAVGIAISKGLIPNVDTEISALLPKNYKGLIAGQHSKITLKHLLTMSSGLSWTEDKTENDIETENDWIAAIINLPLQGDVTPGTKFNYSTGNSHLLSAILEEATPQQTVCEFIHKNLLTKIGIVAEHWGRDRTGYFSGGYDLYLTARELAKFGMLYLNDGVWNGEQIVPSRWVKDSMTRQIAVPPDRDRPEEPHYDYGYNFWLRKFGNHDAAMAWGHGGQMVYIIKDLNMVVVMTTNTRWFEQDRFNGAAIMEDCVIPAVDGGPNEC
jgi:CubicO group peptidase (beta-lactamase class C family)